MGMSFMVKILGNDTNENMRNLWIAKELESIPDGKKILDAGAGELRWKNACSHLQYVSQDFCQYEGTGDGKGMQTGKWDTTKIDIVSDIVNIPVENEEFDVVLCSEVLEHIPSPELAIKEFARILKSGGTLLLTAPFNSLTHFSPYHYCTGFNRYWYETILSKYGFEIENIEANGGYFDYARQELLRMPAMEEKYTGRKSFVFKCFCFILVFMVNKVIKRDGRMGGGTSDELCTFGYHVKARKK